jgi:hypothetical protein
MTQESNFTFPSLAAAGALYQAAARVKELAPWTWMEESEMFGVQDPETGALGFVSVMGMAGEHFAVAVYQGAAGLYGILDFAAGEATTNPQQLLDIPQLQASFEDRAELTQADRDVIKQLKLKFRGAHAWPMFRSYQPGYMPWYVTADEARFLTHALEQTLEVAPRVRANPALLYAADDKDETFLVRVARRADDALIWSDEWMHVTPPEPVRVAVELDAELVAQLKQLPHRRLGLELDLVSLPAAIGARGTRPTRPYMLMLADGRSGMIVGFELLQAEPTLAEMHAQIPLKLADWLMQAQVVPEEIHVRASFLPDLLHPLTSTLSIRLAQTDSLPAIDAAMDSMFGFMAGGEF